MVPLVLGVEAIVSIAIVSIAIVGMPERWYRWYLVSRPRETKRTTQLVLGKTCLAVGCRLGLG